MQDAQFSNLLFSVVILAAVLAKAPPSRAERITAAAIRGRLSRRISTYAHGRKNTECGQKDCLARHDVV